MIIVVSDNGASAEGGVHGTFNEALFFNGVEETLEDNLEHYDGWGGVDTFPHYSWGWTWAGDTPFRRWKRETYRGGVTDPCIVHWPAGIPRAGETRTQFLHVIDIAPTVLDALGLATPATIRGVTQSPIQGRSFAESFTDPDAPDPRDTQYFEMFGHRSLYHDGWKANCPFPGPSFAEAAEHGRFFGMPLTADLLDELDADSWELYDITNDPAETTNLAAEHPERLRGMVRRWYAEAGTYGVLPIVSADLARMNVERPTVSRPRDRYVYLPDSAPVAFAAAPKLYNRPYSVTADVVIPTTGPRASSSRWAAVRPDTRSSSSTDACTTSTTTSVWTASPSRRPTRFPPAGTASATSSSPAAPPTSPTGAALRGPASSTSTKPWSPPANCPTPLRTCSGSSGSAAATQPSIRSTRSCTAPRSASPGPSTRSPSTSPETSSKTPKQNSRAS